MDKKSLARVEVKNAELGEVEALFATFDVVDRDGDVTRKGAYKSGAHVRISAFGHKSWEGALPVGKGVIHETSEGVVLRGQFFMNTQAGRDTFEVVKELKDQMEWSYGFDVDESEPGEHEGKSVRILKRMTVHEVSPVMLGAGVGTRTLGVKSFNDEITFAVDAVKVAAESAVRVVALRAEKGKQLSQVNRESLNELAALCDELKALTVETEDETDELEQIALTLIAEDVN